LNLNSAAGLGRGDLPCPPLHGAFPAETPVVGYVRKSVGTHLGLLAAAGRQPVFAFTLLNVETGRLVRGRSRRFQDRGNGVNALVADTFHRLTSVLTDDEGREERDLDVSTA
jgi:hypothetical protein